MPAGFRHFAIEQGYEGSREGTFGKKAAEDIGHLECQLPSIRHRTGTQQPCDHGVADKAEKAAHWLANKLLEKLGKARVLGPEKGMVERVRNKFLFDILLKLEKDKINIKSAKVFLQEQIDELMTQREFRGVFVVVDVDAV